MAQLIAALDYTNAADALATANALRGCPIWMKVGLELFTHEGPSVAARLKEMGFKVMLDLKMFDIPNTVKGGVRSACLMGVDLITVHALGGERMIRAAREAIEESAASGGARPLLFAVTVLTSMAPGELPGLRGRPARPCRRSRGRRAGVGARRRGLLRPRSGNHQTSLPLPALPDARHPPRLGEHGRSAPRHDARAGRARRKRFPRGGPPHHQGPRPRGRGPGYSGRDGEGISPAGQGPSPARAPHPPTISLRKPARAPS